MSLTMPESCHFYGHYIYHQSLGELKFCLYGSIYQSPKQITNNNNKNFDNSTTSIRNNQYLPETSKKHEIVFFRNFIYESVLFR